MHTRNLNNSFSDALSASGSALGRPTVAVALLFVLGACSGGGGGSSAAVEPIQTDPTKAPGLLSQASDDTALEESIKRGLKQSYNIDNAPLGLNSAVFAVEEDSVALAAADASPGAPAAGDRTNNFTTTYTLEADVGEADIVKYDGELMYTLQQPRYQSCDDCADGYQLVPAQPQIRIVRTDPSSATANEVGAIPIEESSDDFKYLQVQGMYLPQPGQLVLLQTTGYFGVCGNGWIEPANWAQQVTRVTFYDTSDPSAPSTDHVIELDGAYTASRRVDGRLYLVSRYTPSTPFPQPFYAAEAEELEALESNIDDVALSDLVPKQRHNDAEETDLFTATDCYVPTDSEETPDSASLTTVSVIPFDAPESMQSTCYSGEAYGMYMSTESLYLSSQRYEYTETSSADFSVFHKFGLDGLNVDYRGSAEVPGTLGHGEQLDFRMSELDGLLRVVTSEYIYSEQPDDLFFNQEPDAGADNIDHRVTVLRESTTVEELEIVSTLPNESRPAEIGKPDERLYGVRFFGERAYLVTFETIDPLYIIDLSNPEDPLIAGELELPGVADFLHPVSEDLLLTVGLGQADENFPQFVRGVKLELINVADISAPYSLNNLIIGNYASSEALYERHAFTYLSIDESSARFALPIDAYNGTSLDRGSFVRTSGLHLFELNNIADPGNAMLEAAGVITPNTNYGQRRSFFHDDAVYFLSNGNVWSAFWDSPESVNTLTN